MMWCHPLSVLKYLPLAFAPVNGICVAFSLLGGDPMDGHTLAVQLAMTLELVLKSQ